MIYQQPGLGKAGIPALRGTVFIYEILPFHLCQRHVGLVLCYGLQGIVSAVFNLLRRLHPSKHIPLNGIHIWRTTSKVVVTAAVHDVVLAYVVLIVTAAFFIVRVIEIRQAQGVREFMACGADGAHGGASGASQFRCTEVSDKILPAHLPEIGRPRLMRPYGLFRGPFSFVVAGVIEQDHVYVTVVVGIIIVDAYLVAHQFIRLQDCLRDRPSVTVIICR